MMFNSKSFMIQQTNIRPLKLVLISVGKVIYVTSSYMHNILYSHQFDNWFIDIIYRLKIKKRWLYNFDIFNNINQRVLL